MSQRNIFDLLENKSDKEQGLLQELCTDVILLEREVALWREGFQAVAGVDEVGRGPLAGPVVACACILPRGVAFHGIQDSKKLEAGERKRIADILTSHPDIHWAIGIVSSEKIDQINILKATLLAMQQAIRALPVRPDFILVDGRDTPTLELPQQAIIRGDTLSQSIAAASIIAKVRRDEIMDEYHQRYPQYGFNKHKGYGTKAHLDAIQVYGLCPIHRRSFGSLKEAKDQELPLFT
jgi:ribonuclease HII